MPELPEIESLCRALRPRLCDRMIATVQVRERRLRYPVDARALRRRIGGRRVCGVRRRGKYLLFDLAPANVLLVHLGMSGTLELRRAVEPRKHDHILFGLDDGLELCLNDPRRFGIVDAFSGSAEAAHPRLAHLGVEPLDPGFDGAYLHRHAQGRQRSLKTFLMDASVVVGVGNIYASEALFLAGAHPSRAAGRVSAKRWAGVVAAVKETLQSAIEAGGTTLRDYRSVDGEPGTYAPSLRVYGREGEPCERCGRTLRRLVQAGRSTFYCPGCQH